jgi:hypothetical protein
MDYTSLGSSGMRVSRIALGCMGLAQPIGRHSWTLDEEAAQPIFPRAVDWLCNHPVALDPPPLGTGDRRRPPRQDGLDTGHPGGRTPAGLLGWTPPEAQ